jgi:hypothetical protein
MSQPIPLDPRLFDEQPTETASESPSASQSQSAETAVGSAPSSQAARELLNELPTLGNGKRDLTSWIWSYGICIRKNDGDDYWRCTLCKCLSGHDPGGPGRN